MEQGAKESRGQEAVATGYDEQEARDALRDSSCEHKIVKNRGKFPDKGASKMIISVKKISVSEDLPLSFTVSGLAQ